MNSIGKVNYVSFDKLHFEVFDFDKLVYNSEGRTNTLKGLSDYVTIVNDENRRYIYQVIQAADKEIEMLRDENSKYRYIGNFECIPVGEIKNDIVVYNMETYPFLRNNVYLTSAKEMNILFSNNSNNSMQLGIIKDIYNAKVDLNKLFTHHTAVLGNTGSGKTTTIKTIIEETKKHSSENLRLHVLDIHGEYSTGEMDKNTDIINVHKDYKIGIMSLDRQDWINLVKPSELVQLPTLEIALKIGNIVQRKDEGFKFLKFLKLYLARELYRNVQTDAGPKRTKILMLLDSTNIKTIDYKSSFANFASPELEASFLKSITDEMEKIISSTDYDKYISGKLECANYNINSFEYLLKGLEFAFLFEESKGNSKVRAYCGTLETRIKGIQSSYSNLLVEEMKDEKQLDSKITIYSLDNFDDEFLLFFSSFLVKENFEKSKNNKKEDSVTTIDVFILEEAHRYISKVNEARSFHELELFKKISREGRKFGCFLFLSSQRPSELSSTVLSQCNNYLIHRIKNNIDLDYMIKTIPYISTNQMSRFSYLPTGTAYLIGELYPIPIEIKVPYNDNATISSTPYIHFNTCVSANDVVD